MSETIHFSEKFRTSLAKYFAYKSVTEHAFNHNIDAEFSGSDIVHIYEIATTDLNNYDKTVDPSTGSRFGNTSAIIALQRAANTPMEMIKQDDHEKLEEAARIWKDIMSVKYGVRMVEVDMDMDEAGEQPLGMNLPKQTFMQPFDFSQLKNVQLAIEQEVGASSYWSEMASMQTLDNLLMNKKGALPLEKL